MKACRNILVFIVFLALVAPHPLPRVIGGTAAAQDFDDDFDDEIEDAVESDIEDAVESDIEDAVESDIEDAVESDIEDAVESDIEDAVESDIEDAVESDIEDAVESDIEDAVESDIEDAVESDIEDAVESDIEDAVESDIEDAVEDDLESDVEDDLEEDVEDDLEADIENDLERDVEGDIEGSVEDDLQDDIENYQDEEDIGDDLVDDVDDADDDGYDDDDPEDGIDDEDEDDDDSEDRDDADDIDDEGDADDEERRDADFYRIDLERVEDEALVDERIVLIDTAAAGRLAERGYQTRAVTRLDGLGQILARIEVPDGFDLNTELAALQADDAGARIDFNHVYSPEQSPEQASDGVGFVPARFWPRDVTPLTDLHIGSIDSGLGNHAAFERARINEARFVIDSAQLPRRHGTAVASILVGQSKSYQGLLPGARLSHATAFQRSANGRTLATTGALILALDWMAQQNVTIINMSLAGPPNTALARAIELLAAREIFIVAAVGNKGPAAAPLYPAAHPDVIAVTAINARTDRPYRLAGRGPHVDFAAPGIAIVGAAAGSDYRRYTGTSFAAPFATALTAVRCATRPCRTADEIRRVLSNDVVDLGTAGRDPVFGWGRLRPTR